MKVELELRDGILLDENGYQVYDYADYFADVEEAQKWINTNGRGEVVKQEAV